MSLPSPVVGPFGQMDPREMRAFEAPLIALTNQSGGDLRKLLFVFFSFLHRRTDFYLVPNEEDLKEGKAGMGFREGDAEKLLLAAFRQFPLRRIPRKPTQPNEPTKSDAAGSDPESKPAAKASHDSAEKSKKEVVEPTPSKDKGDEKSDNPSSLLAGVRLTEEGLQVPVGNGGSTERYKWTQTIDECSVMFGVPEGCRGKDLAVSIKPTSVSIKAKRPLGDAKDPQIFLEGTLSQKTVPDESTWSLEGGIVTLILYKRLKTYWKTIIEGDPMIDTTMVDSRRHIGEYDESTQAQIRKAIFDQSQGRRGLPSSDEISGAKPTVPPLPPGVEYIDQETLDKQTK